MIGKLVCIINSADGKATIRRIPDYVRTEQQMEEWLDLHYPMTDCVYGVISSVSLQLEV